LVEKRKKTLSKTGRFLLIDVHVFHVRVAVVSSVSV